MVIGRGGGFAWTGRRALGLLAAACARGRGARRARRPIVHTRAIPATGERIPVVGLGTWLTFDVGGADSPARRARGRRAARLPRRRRAPGGLLAHVRLLGGGDRRGARARPRAGALRRHQGVDHGRARGPPADGALARALAACSASTSCRCTTCSTGKRTGRRSRRGRPRAAYRYIGMTTSHGRRHDELEAILRRERLDFVQFTYNLNDREVEERAAAAGRRSRRGGDREPPVRWRRASSVRATAQAPARAGRRRSAAKSWAEAFLKWIVAHPAVTCAIPATSQLAHLQENMRALSGPLPDAALRRRIAEDYARA